MDGFFTDTCRYCNYYSYYYAGCGLSPEHRELLCPFFLWPPEDGVFEEGGDVHGD